jgi:hypothetical protein
MMNARSLVNPGGLSALALVVGVGVWPLPGNWGAAAPQWEPNQGAIIDEGAFRISRAGAPAAEVESFRISRGDNGQIIATGQLSSGTRRITSRLVADTAGTPITYSLMVFDNSRTKTSEVRAVAQSGRLSTISSNQRGDEAMRDYPMGHERTVILDDELVHQLYFSGLSSRSGAIRVISPHAARSGTFVIAARGLEPIDVGGQSVTATHLSLVNGADQRDFWVDADGHVLRVETASGLKAVRDELPRKR